MANGELDPVDVDTLFNRLAVARAHSERIVQSWLPPKPKSDSRTKAGQDDDVDPALDKLDARVAEDWIDTVGIGYRPAGESLEELAGPKRSLLSNDRLRSLLLGTEATKGKDKGRSREKRTTITGKLEGIEGPLPQRNGEPTGQSKPADTAVQSKRPAKESDSEEELGRSAIGRKRSKAKS